MRSVAKLMLAIGSLLVVALQVQSMQLNFPALMQIQQGVWFEGIRDFLIGVKAKRPFRVRE